MIRWILLATLLATPALAQQQMAPSEQALSAKLGAEIGLGLKCSADLIAAQAELEAAKQKIKKLEEEAKK
jgi:hypothetical protein